jgi:hypothetical protein
MNYKSWIENSCKNNTMTDYQVCNSCNMASATSGAGTDYHSGAPEFTPGFQWDSCYSIFSLMLGVL